MTITVKKLMQAVKNTLPAIADAMERLRSNMIIFKYQLLHISSGKHRIKQSLNLYREDMNEYIVLADKIKAQRGAFFAVLAHNLMDTSFFYIATVPFMIMISAQDEGKTRLLGGAVVKCIFSVFSVLFAWNTLQCLQ